MLTLPEAFQAAVADSGDGIAFHGAEGARTWREWERQANAVARGLQELGVRPGDVVAVRLPNSEEFLVLHVAVAMIGAVLLPVPLDCGQAELQLLLDRTGPSMLVLPERWRDQPGTETWQSLGAGRPEHLLLADCPATVPGSLRRLAEDWADAAPVLVEVRPESPLVLVASSGTSSARPKICVHSHAGLLANAATVLADGGAPRAGEVLVSASPFSFLFGLLSVHVCVLARATQALLPTWRTEAFQDLARATGPAVLFAVPTQLRDILQGDAPGRLRQVRTGGAQVPEDLVREVRQLLADEVVIQWGMTELGAGTYTRPGDPLNTVGRPVTGAQARVVGAAGELEFHSPTMFLGYHGEPELTAQAFTPDGWFRTGDLASIDDAGFVTLRGRTTDLVNVGGRKVNAAELERAITALAPVREAVVVACPDHRLGEVPALICTVHNGHSLTLAEVTEHLLAQGQARHALPVVMLVVADLPRTPNGKIARHQVRDLAIARLGEPQDTLTLVRELASDIIGAPVTPDEPFHRQGFDSLSGVRLATALAAATGIAVSRSLIFDCPTPRAVAQLLAGGRRAVPSPVRGDTGEPLAIIGLGCRLPGGIDSPEAFWALLAEGGQVRTELPRDRDWPLDELYSAVPAAGRTSVRHGAFLAAAGDFDAEFFGLTEREARTLDPQQRVLLETAWQALERAGLTQRELRGSDTGVFVGMMASDYAPSWFAAPEHYDGALGLGTAASTASGRLAYLLDTHGPALTVDTACSSSLVALHLAGQALRRHEAGLAVVAGVTVMSSPANLVEFDRQGLLAPDGQCKPFDASADGVGLAEGAGVLVLQRLSDAREQGRTVLAVLRGSAVVQDGASNGLTAPNGHAQEAVLAQALRASGLTTAEIDAVEAHGTGTVLGDAVEARALAAVYDTPLWLGSVKANVGHTQAAAGLVSVLKMVLALRHATLPRTPLADQPSPEIGSAALRLLTEPVPWPRSTRPRRAGVSAFGLSGTNAHVVLEEAPDEPVPPRSGPAVPWLFSAPNPAVLPVLAARLRAARPGTDFGHALATGRNLFPHRAAVLPDADGSHLAGLAALADGTNSPHVLTGTASPDSSTVFVFPDNGIPSPVLATRLLAEFPAFAATIENCAAALAEHVPWSLLAVLRGDSSPGPVADRCVAFAVQLGLAALWRAHGVCPDAVSGPGQIAAACVAGELSLPDAVRLLITGTPGPALQPVPTGDHVVIEISTPHDDAPHWFLRSLAEAHVRGAPVDWRTVFGTRAADANPLPTYPFQRRPHWLVPPDEPPARPENREQLLALVLDSVRTLLETDDPALPSSTMDFERQGLTSLDAIELGNRLASTLALDLPATVVFEARTPDRLAEQLMAELTASPAEATPDRPAEDTRLPGDFETLYRLLCAGGHAENAWEMVGAVARLRSFFTAADAPEHLGTGGFRHVTGRHQPTLVCLPAIVSLAGRAEYRNLAAPFAGIRDVVQLDEVGCRDGEALPADLDALVANVLQRVPDGPVVLCGRSFGGWLAHAVATRLAEAGRPPDGVILLDTFWPGEEFVRTFTPRALRRLADRQHELGTTLGLARLTAIGWQLRLLADWRPEPSGVPTLSVLPEEQTPVEQRLHGAGWRLPHTEVQVPADHFSILDGDAGATAEAVETWLAPLGAARTGAP
ncbi:type I polyketide synthase [Amycolatopsis speibonae]|uniref:Beta-ketoacyl synthase N-terminal-like domain-containing protein n=1 Tax=Amycolatopsis speibonae TaxID=1450224 RepID=A0ABV7PB18_9PSEU